jgi:Flp pilus assembly protein TadD
VAELREALRLKKDYPAAHGNLGNALLDLGLLEEAIAAYQETLRLKEDDFKAYCNIGVALARLGRREEAIVQLRKAIRLKKDDPVTYNNLGTILEALGQLDEAIKEYREAISLNEDFPQPHHNLGHALAAAGRLDEAITEYRKAIQLKNDYANAHNSLGVALLSKGLLDDAAAAYQDAIRLNFGGAHHNLAQVRMKQGRVEEAINEYRQAIRFNKADVEAQYWVRNAERLAAIQPRLPGLLKGEIQPANVDECLLLAKICQEQKQLYAAAARLFRDAFRTPPERVAGPPNGERYNAACAAALAGCGQGKDAAALDDQARAGLRKQALDWLRADLTAWRGVLEKGPAKEAVAVAGKVGWWLQDTDFAGVRGEKALAALPAAERVDWRKLWQDVEALRQRAARPRDKGGARQP